MRSFSVPHGHYRQSVTKYRYVGRHDPNITCEIGPIYPDKSVNGHHVCFYSNQAGCSCTDNDLYDYADYAERLFGIIAKIIFPAYIQGAQSSVRCALPKFQKRFKNRVYFCGDSFTPSHLEVPPSPLCLNLSYVAKYEAKCDMFYSMKYGGKAWEPVYPDSFTEDIPTAFHAVAEWDRHGTAYAAITKAASGRFNTVVPHLIRDPDPLILNSTRSWREQFDIPETALVLCNHGGDTFNVPYIEAAVVDMLRKYGTDKLHFLFMGRSWLLDRLHSRVQEASLHAKITRQVHFVGTTIDEEVKECYFLTCSALLHAAWMGEDFGLEIGEFSARNKPVITEKSRLRGGRFYKVEHMHILNDRAYYYENQTSLLDLIDSLVTHGFGNRTDFRTYTEYTPEKVMHVFKSTFFNPIFGTDYYYYPNRTVNGSRICFYSNQASERGTEAAMFDYADFAEKLLGLTAAIIFPLSIKNGPAQNIQSLPNFERRFKGRTFFCGDMHPKRHMPVCPNLSYVAKHVAKCDLLYAMKYGPRSWEPVYPGSFNESLPLAFHAVFEWQKHGTTYAAVSPEVVCSNGSVTVVPHIIRKPNPMIVKHAESLRKDLNIPVAALTLCRHGGELTFDLPYIEAAIVDILEKHEEKKLHFVFLGTSSLQQRLYTYVSEMNSTIPYKTAMVQKIDTQIHFLNATTVEAEKERFFTTCDAMLHAGRLGETFGLAVAEFSVRNKPVITQAYVGDSSYRTMHVKILKDKAYYYRDRASLVALVGDLLAYGTGNISSYDAYAVYSAENVMQQFKEVFLDPVFGGG